MLTSLLSLTLKNKIPSDTIIGEDISKDEKIEKLKLIAKETVDIRGIGFYTLGKKRKSLNEQEKKNMLNFLKDIF